MCGIHSCPATFSKFSSFKSHIYRSHRDVLGIAEPAAEADDQLEQHADIRADLHDNDPPPPPLGLDSVKLQAAKFLLKAKEGLRLSQTACDELVGAVTRLVETRVDHVRI